MSKLSELKPGQKISFSPIEDKAQKLTGEIVDYVFLAVVKTADGKTRYAHSDDVEVLEQPKPKLSEQLQSAIADEVKNAIAAASAPAAPAKAEWIEETPTQPNSTEEK